MLFSQLTLVSNNLVLESYLSSIYLESWFSWLWEGVQKRLTEEEKTEEQTEEKH